MKTLRPCIIYSSAEAALAERLSLRRGRLSYIADGDHLLCEKLPSGAVGDIMIVSMERAGEHIASAIYDECRRRRYSGVFLDIDMSPDGTSQMLLDSVAEALVQKVRRVYIPEVYSRYCTCATPVASCAVSGGLLSEYLEQLVSEHRNLALSIPVMMSDFSMPSDSPAGRTLTQAELSRLQSQFDADVYYSAQMLTNYFTYSPSQGTCRFVLFDDARSISEKIKLAKSFGITDIFLSWREISHIAGDIIF